MDSNLLTQLRKMNLSVRAKSVLNELARYTRWQHITLAEYLQDPPPLEGVGDVRTSAELRRAIKRLHNLERTKPNDVTLSKLSVHQSTASRAALDRSHSERDIVPRPVSEACSNHFSDKRSAHSGVIVEISPEVFSPRRMLRLINELPTRIDTRRMKSGAYIVLSHVSDEECGSESEAELQYGRESPNVTGVRVACVNLFDLGCHVRALYEYPAAKKAGMYEWVDRICKVTASVHLAAIEGQEEIISAAKSDEESAAIEELTYLVDTGFIGEEPFNAMDTESENLAGEISLLNGVTSYWTRQLVARVVQLRALLLGDEDPASYKDVDA